VFIHLGEDYTIFLDKVIAVINIEGPLDRSVKDIIDLAQVEKKLVRIGDQGREKSLVITDDQVYLSPISSLTLFRRGHNLAGGGHSI